MDQQYHKYGFCHKPQFFTPSELDGIHDILLHFHRRWMEDNKAFYQNRAINSAYITGKTYLNDDERLKLFQFIGSEKIATLARNLIGETPAFMNTQLFFNPVNPAQKNYWHRDVQYTGMSIEQQQQALVRQNVIHLRIPLASEPGIELVPDSHTEWDNDEEFDVRMERNGKSASDDLMRGKTIPLARGDLLMFSANMIHRGLYGGDRFAFDIIFCGAESDLLQHAHTDCLPDSDQLELIEDAEIFRTTADLKKRQSCKKGREYSAFDE